MSMYEYQDEPSEVDVSDFLDHLQHLENKRKHEDESRTKKLEAELHRMKTISRSSRKTSPQKQKSSRYDCYEEEEEEEEEEDENIDFDSDQENKYMHSPKAKEAHYSKAMEYEPRISMRSIKYDSPNRRSPTRTKSPNKSPARKLERYNDEIEVYYDDTMYDGSVTYEPEPERDSDHSISELEDDHSEDDYYNDNRKFNRSSNNRESLTKKLSMRARKYIENDDIEEELDDEDIDNIIRLISPIAKKLSKSRGYSTKSPSRERSKRTNSPTRRGRALPKLPTIESDVSLDDEFEEEQMVFHDEDIIKEDYYPRHRSQSPRRLPSPMRSSTRTKSPSRANTKTSSPARTTLRTSLPTKINNSSTTRSRSPRRSRSPVNENRFDEDEDEEENIDEYLKFKSAYNYTQSINSRPNSQDYEYDDEFEEEEDHDSLLQSSKFSSSVSSYRSKNENRSSPNKEPLDLEFDKPIRTSTMKRSTIFDYNLDTDQETSIEDYKPKRHSPTFYDIEESETEDQNFSLSQPNSLANKIKQHSETKKVLNKDQLSRSLPNSDGNNYKPATNISESTKTLLRRLTERESNSPTSLKRGSTIAENFDVAKFDKNNELNSLASFLRSQSIRGKNSRSPSPIKQSPPQVIEEEEEEKEEGNDTTTIHTTVVEKSKMLDKLVNSSPRTPLKSQQQLVNKFETRNSRFETPIKSQEQLINKFETRTSRFETPKEIIKTKYETNESNKSRGPSPVRDLINKHNTNKIFSDDKEVINTPTKRSNKFSTPKSISSIASKFENGDDTPLTPSNKFNSDSPSMRFQKLANRYTPRPNPEDAISAGLAAKANTLNREVSKTVGEKDFSLSDQAKFIKPSVAKGAIRNRYLDQIQEKENKRSNLINKQGLNDMLKEIQENGKIPTNNSKKPQSSLKIGNEIDRLFNQEPDFLKLKNKPKNSPVSSPKPINSEPFVLPNADQFIKLKNELSSSPKRNDFKNPQLPDDANEVFNKIRSKSPDRLNKLNKPTFNKDIPDDANEIINKIRSKSPQRINDFEKNRKNNFNDVPNDALEVIRKIRKQF